MKPGMPLREPVVDRSDSDGGACKVEPRFEVRTDFDEPLLIDRVFVQDQSQLFCGFHDPKLPQVFWRRLAWILIDQAEIKLSRRLR